MYMLMMFQAINRERAHAAPPQSSSKKSESYVQNGGTIVA